MSMHEGDLLSGRYRLERSIAAGGMGEVWRGTDELLGRPVAIKILHEGPTASGGEDYRARFRDEARHSAALSHPNIATVHDFGDDEDHPYLVMELVEGESLATLVARRGPLPADEVSSLLGQAALALSAAHAAGVVHRDVKPANIVVTPAGMVKLTDFGIARVAAAAGLTRTGEVLGTPHYLSPEQALGQPATVASDVYALGVIGYELLTGARPFDAESMVATALAHVNQQPPPLPDTVPNPLRSTVMACLAKDPADRPGSAAQVATALGMPTGQVTPLVGALPAVEAPAKANADAIAEARTVAPAEVPAVAPAGATMALPMDAPPEESRRSGAQVSRAWPWLLPAAGALVVVALVVAAANLTHRPTSPTPSPRGTSTISPSHTTTRPTHTASPTKTSTTVAAPRPVPARTSPAHAPAHQHGKGKGKGGKKK